MANAVDKIDRVFVLINQKIVHYSVERMCFCIFLVHFIFFRYFESIYMWQLQ